MLTTSSLQAQQDLPNSVNGIDRNMKDTWDLFNKLLKLPANDANVLHWLGNNIDALPTLFRYELARRYNVAGKREMALLEYARARLGRDMDASECIKKDDNNVMVIFTDQLGHEILVTPRFDQDLFFKAISEALKLERQDRRISALWLCGKDNLKDDEAAITARKAAYEFLKSDFEKISADAKK